MGCDIHLYFEVRHKLTGKWHFIGRGEGDRNYLWFGVLNDVREEGQWDNTKPWFDRGLPDDVSDTVFNEHQGWGRDAHSCTWLSSDELVECWNKFIEVSEIDDREAVRKVIFSGAGENDTTLNSKIIEGVPELETCGMWSKNHSGKIHTVIYPQLKIANGLITKETPVFSDGWYDDFRLICWFDN